MDPNGNTNDASRAPLTYSLKLEGDGMAVDKRIDEATAFEVIALVMSGGASTTIKVDDSTRITHQVPRPRRSGRQSLREYLDAVQAKRNPDKILAVAKYVTEDTGKTTVTRDDVRARFRDAAEPVPGNYTRDFNWVVKNGWLARDASDRNEFYVTDTGDEALAAKFDAEIKKKTGVAKGRRGGKRRRKTTAS